MYYGLVDCNNFFVSCERAFQPGLEGRPVVVLSNNDGCVVARSNESKAMGIKMGTPFYQISRLADSGRLVVRSSNYALYGDLSRRVMSIVRDAAGSIEIYSIDEAFMHLEGMEAAQMTGLCRDLVQRIRRWTGIPVSIGIASSKTLAKVANHFAKRYPGYRGVCLIDTPAKLEKALSLTPIDDVWGVGWRGAPKLMSMGVKTAADLVSRPLPWIQKHMGITGVRTWQELQGMDVIPEEPQERKRLSICTSRSFADMITGLDELELRVADFAANCARKLRSEGTAAGRVSVFAHTNRFRDDLPQYYPYEEERLEFPASSTREIVSAALSCLRRAYREGYAYKRAGVIVDAIEDASALQGSLFDSDAGEREKDNLISGVMDRVNTLGDNTLRLATQRPGHYSEGIRREHCSKLYTTSWDDIIEVR